MNADMKWLDNPEVFRVNQLEAHSDHTYYESYEALEKKENALIQSLNGQWEFVFSKNVIYTSDLAEYASLADTQYARGVRMRADGSAVLLGSQHGWLFVP